MRSVDVTKDGRGWRIGTSADVDWLAGRTEQGVSISTVMPLVFDAYATFHTPEGAVFEAQERAVVDELVRHSPGQPWWLGYLDTGAHDVVFPEVPRVRLYWDWPYVLVQAGPEQALTWRSGHMRGAGALPDLFFPADRSWLVSALWDDAWTCVGGSAGLIAVLHRHPQITAHLLEPDDDTLPPGLVRE
ncbi:hypothetical protein ACWKSP_31215 [Micromonosporaceae bacterium Da 78-11]